MTFSSVLAFGGSTVRGEELQNTDSAFPQLVAKYYGVPCYNYAYSGGSNDRSLRILPEKILEHPNSLVLFVYVNFDRTEFFWPGKEYTGPVPPEGAYVPLGVHWLQVTEIDQLLKDRIDMFYKYFYWDPTKFNNYREYNLLLNVDLICQKFSADYVHIFEIPGIINNFIDRQQKILNAVDKSKILDFPKKHNLDNLKTNLNFGSWYDWSTAMKFPRGKSHVLEESHQALADLIIEHLSRK